MKPKILISAMSSWHLFNTAKSYQKLECLSSLWTSNSNRNFISDDKFLRIWPYHCAMKFFYHFAPPRIEEIMRWQNLPFYDVWVRNKKLPDEVNVVQAPMGSCKEVFKLADKQNRKILKVYEAPNSHPVTQRGYWQRELDIHAPGSKIPMPDRVFARMTREIVNADLILCPSKFVRDTMVMNGVSIEKCFVNRFGVDTSTFTFDNNHIRDKSTFIFVGNLTLRKGLQYLIPAFLLLKEKIKDAKLIVVGSIRPDFKKFWPKYKNHVVHYEYLNHKELAVLFKTCTAMVFPSLEEGFARVLSEAMASSLPVIATYESGATTIIEHGINGLIVPSGQLNPLVDAMESMVMNTELRERIIKSALDLSNIPNSWDDYAMRNVVEFERRLKEL